MSAMRVSRAKLAAGAFVALVLAGEVVGRWLVTHLPLVDHAPRRPQGGLDAWPVLVVAAKIAIALLLARMAWRIAKAHRLARAGERILHALGEPRSRPAPAVGLSHRAWLAAFVAMSLLYLAPTSTAELADGWGPLFAPWLHTQAFPVFAVVAVVVAVLWRTVSRWVAALEHYATRLQAFARRRRAALAGPRRTHAAFEAPPRSLFGVAFDSRPPPLPA